mgnify:CR=1 FL=1
MGKTSPIQFLRQVKQEVKKVTWPAKKEVTQEKVSKDKFKSEIEKFNNEFLVYENKKIQNISQEYIEYINELNKQLDFWYDINKEDIVMTLYTNKTITNIDSSIFSISNSKIKNRYNEIC